MRRRAFIAGIGSVVVGPISAYAQQRAKVNRVAWLNSTSPLSTMLGADPPHPQIRAFLQRMRELGYVVGSNLVLEMRTAEGHHERLPEIVRELVAQNVDVIVSPSNVATRAAKGVTTSVPIVMVGNALPVELGFVQSLARPGGNITGSSLEVSLDYTGKRLELTKELFPAMKRLGVLTSPETLPILRKHLEETSRRLEIDLLWAEHSATDFTRAFALLDKERPDALYVIPSRGAWEHRQTIVDFVRNIQLPATYPSRDYAAVGGLVSFGVNIPELGRRAADYVDRILKGENPAEIPIERPVRYELVINQREAKLLGLTLPQTVLIRADELIE